MSTENAKEKQRNNYKTEKQIVLTDFNYYSAT